VPEMRRLASSEKRKSCSIERTKDMCCLSGEVSEAALAHRIPHKVRTAYLQTQFLNERRTADASVGSLPGSMLAAAPLRGAARVEGYLDLENQ
jgi:hypothetical protein